VSEGHARLRIDVFTLFPGMFAGPLDESILKRARAAGLVEIAIHDLRAWTHDRHHTADDTPYGGGPGMVMLAPPIIEGVEAMLGPDFGRVPIRVMSAAGRLFTQAVARELARAPRLVLVCGHYEGIDQRAIDLLGAEELSIGDYVLTGGELPAMVVIDAVCRLVPGAIDAASIEDESHAAGLLEYPHYTRPAVYRDLAVPPVLLSGHHAEIARWRRRAAIARTARRRPDLLEAAHLSEVERALAALARSSDKPPTDSTARPTSHVILSPQAKDLDQPAGEISEDEILPSSG
jgi:tRNA (guanine37-N1)-methyltransferase